ncbi:MAG TPA: hypothetical protein VM677_25725, partial [Actinokineospora sp.]|nr:hypothetical protein [Actinokineospora sp.]
MQFEGPDAYNAMINKSASVATRGEAWDVIGERLSEGVDRKVPAYDAKLQLNLNPKSPEKRQEINELRWGKIKKDAAKLDGVAAGMENIAMVIKKGKDQLSHDWKGESFEAFKTAVERVEKTLTDYAAAAKTTAAGLTSAMTSSEQIYNNYANSAVTILSFNDFPKAEDWKKVTQANLDDFADSCADWHEWTFQCDKDDDDAKELIDKVITPQMYQWFDANECDESGDKVRSMVTECITKSNGVKDQIAGKIHEWYVATDTVRTRVSELQDAALENLRIMSELKVFGRMKVPGAPSGNGSGNNGNGNNGNGNTGGPGNTGGGGGTPGGGGGGTPLTPTPPTPQMPEPDLSSLEDGKTDPSATDPTAVPPGVDAKSGETVTIEEGDRKISVTSPDGEGQVKVTVDDGTGKPKTYTMDFGAAGVPGQAGLPGAPGMAEPGVGDQGFGPDGQPVPGGADGQLIEPGPDGKCVVSDPPMTITAERPGGGDVVLVTVDDGTGEPTSYTLDYSEAKGDTAIGQPPASSAAGGSGQPGSVDALGARIDTAPAGAPGGPESTPLSAAPGGAGEPAYAMSEQTGTGTGTQESQLTSAQSVSESGGAWGSAGSFVDGQSGGFGPTDVQAAGAGEAG